MSEKPKGQPVKLRITSCVVGWSGTNKRGDQSTIYEIQACRENGEPITDKKLKSWEELPVGELLDLMVVPFPSERYGLSYTLSRKNKVGSHQRINEMQGDMKALLARIEAVENWIGKQAGSPQQVPQVAPVAAAPAAPDAAQQADLDARFGATPPY